jgi:hypothetical protein
MACKKTNTQQPEIERSAFDEFRNKWHAGKFQHLRYGQAFYNHFGLHKMSDQDYLGDLYELDGDAARAAIGHLFRIA